MQSLFTSKSAVAPFNISLHSPISLYWDKRLLNVWAEKKNQANIIVYVYVHVCPLWELHVFGSVQGNPF